MKQTVFIQVDPNSRLPDKDGAYNCFKIRGVIIKQNFCVKSKKWWAINSYGDRYVISSETLYWMEQIDLDIPEQEYIPYQNAQDNAMSQGYNNCLDDLKHQLKIY